LGKHLQMKVIFKGNRIDNDQEVYGYYFVSPLTDENSGTSSDKGWFFLSGEKRHCISTEQGVVFVVKEESVEVVSFTVVTEQE
jgi:hypothetical protein